MFIDCVICLLTTNFHALRRREAMSQISMSWIVWLQTTALQILFIWQRFRSRLVALIRWLVRV
tara:strand:+ start:11654 stop:11842 length:189 start_codon:yes stop_codon:yes gene_type:complete